MDLSLSLGRFLTGALISALLAIGGVWFVVDVSLRGVEGNILRTNKRIDDVQTQIDRRFDELNRRLDRDFSATNEILRKRASLDSINDDTRLVGTPFLSKDGKVIGTIASVSADKSELSVSPSQVSGLPQSNDIIVPADMIGGIEFSPFTHVVSDLTLSGFVATASSAASAGAER